MQSYTVFPSRHFALQCSLLILPFQMIELRAKHTEDYAPVRSWTGRKPRNQHVYKLPGKFTIIRGIEVPSRVSVLGQRQWKSRRCNIVSPFSLHLNLQISDKYKEKKNNLTNDVFMRYWVICSHSKTAVIHLRNESSGFGNSVRGIEHNSFKTYDLIYFIDDGSLECSLTCQSKIFPSVQFGWAFYAADKN